MKNSDKAKKIMTDGGYTCVFVGNNEIITSSERGVKPLLELLESKKDFTGFSAADKVVGKGAAFLYILLGVKEVYAEVISEPAAKVLTDNGIMLQYGEKVKNVINRTGDGICPIESAVLGITSPKTALEKIYNRLRELQTGEKI